MVEEESIYIKNINCHFEIENMILQCILVFAYSCFMKKLINFNDFKRIIHVTLYAFIHHNVHPG